MGKIVTVSFPLPASVAVGFEVFARLSGTSVEELLSDGFVTLYHEKIVAAIAAAGQPAEPGGLRRSEPVKDLLQTGFSRSPRVDRAAKPKAKRKSPKRTVSKSAAKPVKTVKAAKAKPPKAVPVKRKSAKK